LPVCSGSRPPRAQRAMSEGNMVGWLEFSVVLSSFV
jgi:hypothetical protein